MGLKKISNSYRDIKNSVQAVKYQLSMLILY